jgi:hypothetical protein
MATKKTRTRRRIRIGGATWYVGTANYAPAWVAHKDGWLHTVPASGPAVVGSFIDSMEGPGGVVFATDRRGTRIPATGDRVEARIRSACKRAWHGRAFGLDGEAS